MREAHHAVTAALDTRPASLPWWPAPGSAEDAEWSERTLDVVNATWRREGAVLYWRRGTEELRDDLRSWLVVQALEFRAGYVPPADPYPDALTAWLRILVAQLRIRSRHHFGAVMRVGVSPPEARHLTYARDSTDRTLTGNTVDAITVGTLGRSLWPAGEPTDPEVHYIARESLAAVLGSQRVHGWGQTLALLDEAAPEPGAGQCRTWGCGRPPSGGRWCSPCNEVRRREQAAPCAFTGCGKPGVRTGLCQGHYYAVRRTEVEQCTTPGCDKPSHARGLCPMHYQRARRARTASAS